MEDTIGEHVKGIGQRFSNCGAPPVGAPLVLWGGGAS
jgi:hypothetical protein